MKDIIESLRKFNQERDWEQFHDGKNLALSLSIEAAELNEAFLWKISENADILKIKEERSQSMISIKKMIYTFIFPRGQFLRTALLRALQ